MGVIVNGKGGRLFVGFSNLCSQGSATFIPWFPFISEYLYLFSIMIIYDKYITPQEEGRYYLSIERRTDDAKSFTPMGEVGC